MPTNTPSANDKLIGRFNMAAFRLGALHGRDLIDDKTAARLFETVNALDAVQTAQNKLHCSTSGSENAVLEKRLELPIRKLRQTFVRQMDAALRKVDKTRLSQRDRKVLQL